MLALTRCGPFITTTFSHLNKTVRQPAARCIFRDFVSQKPASSKMSKTFTLLQRQAPLNLWDIQLIKEMFSKREADVKKLGGLSNHNYLISEQSRHYLARLPLHTPINDRKSEQRNALIAYQLGLNSKIIYSDGSGVMLRKFIEGAPPLDKDLFLTNCVKKMASALRLLHLNSIPFSNDSNYFEAIQKLRMAIGQIEKGRLTKYQEVFQYLHKAEKQIALLPHPKTTCHNSPCLANFILSKQNVLYLIDWEHSGNGDAAWDVAYLFTYANFNEEQQKCFLEEYDVPIGDKSFLERVSIYKPLTKLMTSLKLCLLQITDQSTTRNGKYETWENVYLQQAIELVRKH